MRSAIFNLLTETNGLHHSELKRAVGLKEWEQDEAFEKALNTDRLRREDTDQRGNPIRRYFLLSKIDRHVSTR